MKRSLCMAYALHLASGCVHGASAPKLGPTDGIEPPAAPDVAPEALAQRGRQLLQRGDYLRAEQYLQLALRAGHPERPLIVPLLTTCIGSGRLRAALMHADRHLARHPENWQARFVKAALLRALGEAEMAQLEHARALRDAPPVAQQELARGGTP